MRRRAAAFLAPLLVLAGCGSQGVVQPLPNTVQGKLAAAKGDPAAGKTLFTSQGCGSCHTFKPAGTSAKVGPDLDKLPSYAKRANQGALDEFVHSSIATPNSYVEKGFSPNVMPDYGSQLSSKQIDDLVAFLTKGKGGSARG